MSIINLRDEKIVMSLPKLGVSYAGRIKMYATPQLAECRTIMQSSGSLTIIPTSPSCSPTSPGCLTPPPTYAVRGFGHGDPQHITTPPVPKGEMDEELDSAVSYW
ncbi:Hypothetical protein CINCED_3A001226 [Cinara cedri]|uniref:Uncharacterized protein n=1 Tax=Cinara cedri TaxID=506608 RepID=A0A5E4NBM6_9HEMI|nr:Hypothetical protein CINCED_3A001226 [Cinara cedri]